MTSVRSGTDNVIKNFAMLQNFTVFGKRMGLSG